MDNRRMFLKAIGTGCLAASMATLSPHARAQDKNESGGETLTCEDRVAKAQAMMAEYGSCCTAVLAAYSEELGMDVELAARIGRGMAGGIGSLGHVCGAVSGAAMVVGLKTSNSENLRERQGHVNTSDTVQKLLRKFEEKHGSLQCRELIGHDLSTMELKQKAFESNAFANCPRFVEDAVLLLEEIAEE